MDAKTIIRSVTMRFFYMLRNRKKKTVYFSSFGGKQYSDNPRAISEYLHLIAPDIEIVWTILKSKEKNLPEYVKCVEPGKLSSIKAQSQANVWVYNCILQEGTFKGRDTMYIQTWHGDRAFKKIALDARESMGDLYGGATHYVENDICDYFTVGSDFGERMIRSAFAYNGKVIKAGSPRNDRLVNIEKHQNEVGTIKQSLGISDNVKILLFAPTFRDGSSDLQSEEVNLTEALDILEKSGDQWICLMRAHSLSKGIAIDGKEDTRIINATGYPDMADLLMIADCLITDYSSSAQDFILLNRPVVLAQFDFDEYTAHSRQLYHKQSDIGFLIANNQVELDDILSNLDKYDHVAISKRIQEFYGMYESGNATKEVCNLIVKQCG